MRDKNQFRFYDVLSDIVWKENLYCRRRRFLLPMWTNSSFVRFFSVFIDFTGGVNQKSWVLDDVELTHKNQLEIIVKSQISIIRRRISSFIERRFQIFDVSEDSE